MPERVVVTGLGLATPVGLTVDETWANLLAGTSGERSGRGVHREHDLAELTLRAVRPVAAQVDGESLGELTALTFRSVPDAVRVVV